MPSNTDLDSIREAFLDIYDLPKDGRDTALEQLKRQRSDLFEIVKQLLDAVETNPNAARIDAFNLVFNASAETEPSIASDTQISVGLPGVLKRRGNLSNELPRVRLQRSRSLPDFSNRAKEGRYLILEEIARGGMGAVFRAFDTDLGREVGIKVMLPQHLKSMSVFKRFVEEAQIGGQLQHPGIAPIYDAGMWENDCPYFAMKFVNGGTLGELLDHSDGRNDRSQLLNTFLHVCQAVGYAHQQGVIHRDLKPANIMVGEFGEVLVMDWGLAKVLSDNAKSEAIVRDVDLQSLSLTEETCGNENTIPLADFDSRDATEELDTRLGSLLGTPGYISPEQAQGRINDLGPTSDVFSLGAILFKILTGQSLYQGESQFTIISDSQQCQIARSLSLLNETVGDPVLRDLVRSCLAKEQDDRPRDAGDVGRRLEQYLTSVEERFRNSELELARSKARLIEEKKRRVFQFGFAASVIFALASLAVGIWWAEHKQAAYDASQALQKEQTMQQIQEDLTLAAAYASLQADEFPDESDLEAARSALSRVEKTSLSPALDSDLLRRANNIKSLVDGRLQELHLVQDLQSAYEREMEFRASQRRQQQQANQSSDFDWSTSRSEDGSSEEPPEPMLRVEPFVDPVERFSSAFKRWELSPESDVSETLKLLESLHNKHRNFVVACLDRWRVLLEEKIPFYRWQQCEWSNLQPIVLQSRGGDKLTPLGDGSILVSGENAWAGYDLIFESDTTQISAFRIEALLHDSLPNHGPGRQEGSGVGTLEGLNIEIAPIGNFENRQKASVSYAVSDYSWPKDPIRKDTWHLGYSGGRPHAAVFVLDTPIASDSGFRVWISNRDRNRDFQFSDESLGRFRWSCTHDPLATERISAAKRLWKIVDHFDKDPWRKQIRLGVNETNIDHVIELGSKGVTEATPIASLVQLADWIATIDDQTRTKYLADSVAWQNLADPKLTAKNGTKLQRLPDGSILASGPNPNDEVIEIEASLDKDMGALRLQAIPHDVETKVDGKWQTWSRSGKEAIGDVGLHDVACELIDADGNSTPLKIRPIANNLFGEWGLNDQISDGKGETFAHLWTHQNELNIYFALEEVVELSDERNLRLVVRISTGMGQGNNFGRLRIQTGSQKPNSERLLIVAANLLRKAVELQPDSYWARMSLLSTLFSLDQPDLDECRIHSAAAVALRPTRLGSQVMALETALAEIEQAELGELISVSRLIDRFAIHFPNSPLTKSSIERRRQRLLKLAEKSPEQFAEHENLTFEAFKDDARLLNWMAMRLESQFPDLADKFYQRSAELDPQPYIFYNIGMLEGVRRNRFAEAEVYFRQALELDPNFTEGLTSLAEVLRRQNKAGEALGFAKKSVHIDPNRPFAQNTLARVLSEHGEQRAAANAFIASDALEPGNIFKLSTISREYAWIHELGLARQYYKKALEFAPNNTTFIALAAEMTARLGNPETAIIELSKAIEQHPNDGVLLAARGKIFTWLGNRVRAEEDITKGYELSPNENFPRDTLIKWRITTDTFDKLFVGNREQKFRMPNLPNPLYWHLAYLQKTPDTLLKKTENWITENLSALPRFETLRSQSVRGAIHYRLGEIEESIALLQESIELRGEAAGKERFVLPMALQAAGRKEEATEAFESAEKWRKKVVPFDPSFSAIREEAASCLEIKVEPISTSE
ncbi:protein kinase [Stieleria sp. JC731]|uniref:serine/threonine-protein kinase n=1 Tax=Stieleria sp. JC731 TaxID=2894195 RepID=UPI001E44A8CD|nr:serine/threonine-protein kinase [Stieleria sp. JC731]MCC9601268.1 protein kinase [Stieleria sp. JC731]